MNHHAGIAADGHLGRGEHERADEASGRAFGIAHNQSALEQVQIRTVGVEKAVFPCPVIASAGKRIADAVGRPRTILRMNLLLPEVDITAGAGISEQSFKTLRPGKRAGFYIPIPNSIIRSPGNVRKMFRAFRRAAFRKMMMDFILLGRVSGAWVFVSGWIWRGCLVSLNFGR